MWHNKQKCSGYPPPKINRPRFFQHQVPNHRTKLSVGHTNEGTAWKLLDAPVKNFGTKWTERTGSKKLLILILPAHFIFLNFTFYSLLSVNIVFVNFVFFPLSYLTLVPILIGTFFLVPTFLFSRLLAKTGCGFRRLGLQRVLFRFYTERQNYVHHSIPLIKF